MHLKKLSLIGFKSFPESTEVEFGPGMTGIVGPNGCGKTNILDALRWVLGEQRTSALRSGKMEEVIFNGSRDMKPLGMSEVSLTIANSRGVLPTEYTDLTITRRLYRSGESEYRLNKQPCRLRDILDLFADTGMGAHSYSVIQQDMIEAVLSEKAEERRFLFDEAAGITKYKHRKRAALRKLDATEADLLRLKDIAAEVRTRVNSLKRQSNKAQRYSELREQWQEQHLRLARSDYESLQERVRTQSTRAQNLQSDLEAARARVAAREAQRDALQAQIDESEQSVETARQAVAECDLQLHALTTESEKASTEAKALETRRVELQVELESLRRSQQERARQIEELERDLTDGRQEATVGEEQAASRDQARAEADAEWQRARTAQMQKQEEADQARSRYRQLETEVVHAETALISMCESLTQAESSLKDAETERQAAGDHKGTREAEETRAREALDQAAERLRTARADRETAAQLTQEKESSLNAAQAALTELESEKQVLSSWMETYRGYQGAVPDLLTRDRAAGLVDTVAELIRVDLEAELAVAAALADRAEYLVCRDRSTAQLLLRRLETSDVGRASLIALDALRGSQRRAEAPAGTRSLVDFVHAEEAYGELVEFLLGDFFLCLTEQQPDLEALPANLALVTRHGTLYRGRAQASAGKPSAAGLLARKDELERLESRIDAQKSELTRAHSVATAAARDLESVSGRVTECEATLTSAQEEYRAASLEAERARARFDSAVRDLDRDRSLHGSLVKRVEQAREDIDRLKGERALAEKEHEAQRTTARCSDEALNSAEARRTDAIMRAGEAQVHAVSLRGRVEGLANDLARTREMLEDIEQRMTSAIQQQSESAQRLESIARRVGELSGERTACEKVRAEREAAYVTAREGERDLLTRVQELDRELKSARKAADEVSSHHHDAEMAASEARLEVSSLCDRIRDAHGIDLSSRTDLEPVDPGQRALLGAELQEMKQKLDAMGTVNLLALEEYEEQKERLDFLDQQLSDMESAKKTLLETIDKINITARAQFVETFAKVEQNFNELFAQLFEGGEARVYLDTPEDPLESAISITARPRGKRPVSILQLSGGERALTAIALLFSLYMVKPSPFCILDEIDAPLDDANIGRFLSMLARFSGDTQFIIITHNKMTMQATDILYGVTMEQPGISKLVSVKLNEALEVAGQV